MARPRSIHYRRHGYGVSDPLPVHANGSTRPLVVAEDAHADFLGAGESTTGFDNEGVYKLAGTAQPTGLGEGLGNNANILNGHKWTTAGDYDVAVTDDGIEVSVDGAGLRTYDGRLWSLPADFNIEVFCEVAGIPVGTGAGAGQDSAVWLELHMLSNPASYWRVKRTRTDVVDGFAAEVAGVGAHLGFVADAAASFRLAVIRIGSELELRAYTGAFNYLLWSGTVLGHLAISMGVQGVGGVWTATLLELIEAGITVHDYTGRASWLNEPNHPMWTEDWRGYDMHPLRWSTPAVSGAATISPTTLSSTYPPGSVEIRLTGGAASVSTQSVALDGDFSFSLPFRHAVDPAHSMVPATVDSPLRLELRAATTGYPRLFLEAVYVKDGGGNENTEYRLSRKETAVGGTVTIASFATAAPTTVWREGTFSVAKRGPDLQMSFADGGGIRWDEIVSDFPTVPLRLALGGYASSSGSNFTGLVGILAISQPYATAGPLVSDYIVASYATAAAETVDEGGDEPATAGVALVDTVTRASIWQALGSNLAGPAYDTALPGGEIHGAWVDQEGGRIVLAVEQQGESAQWFTIDFGQDKITRLAADGEREFQGEIAQRHMGLGYGAATAAPAGFPATGVALDYFEVDGCAVWVASSGILVLDKTTGDSATLWPSGDIVRARLAPATGGAPAALVVANSTGDVAVYTSLDDVAAGPDEAADGDVAAATYTAVDGLATYDVDVAQTSGGVHILLARGTAVVVIAPGEPHLVIPCAAGPVSVDEALAPVRAAVFAFAPRIDTSPRNGWIVLGTDDDDDGELSVFSLQTLMAVERIDPRDIMGDDHPSPETASRAVSARSLVGYAPPAGYGCRVMFGSFPTSVGLVELDILSLEVGADGWRGPHVGGVAFGAQGFNLDLVRGVRLGSTVGVGGVACFRLEARPASGFRGPYFSAVPRALGFILNAPANNPVVSNALLIATPEWPQEVSLDLADGSVLALPDAYVYESVLCIEYTAARILAKLPGAMLDPDPKLPDSPQRHFMIAVATQLCWLFRQQAVTRRDSSVATAEGVGLGLLAASYGTRAPDGLDDDALRAWIPTWLGGGVTPKAILDLLEILLGYRPTMTEGYRWFQIDLAGTPDDSNFWGGDVNGVDGFDFWFWDDAFFDGEGLSGAVLALLEHIKAAGVRADVISPLE